MTDALNQRLLPIGQPASLLCVQLHGLLYKIPGAGVQYKEYNTFYSNVDKMSEIGLKPAPPKWLHVCFVINSMNSGRRYHMQVFKIKQAILSKGMSYNDRNGTRTHAHEVTGARKPTPLTMVHPACGKCFFVVNSNDNGRRYHVHVFKIKETILCIGCQQNDRSGSWTHGTEVTGALNQHLKPHGHLACVF